jgi:hypothetical protein
MAQRSALILLLLCLAACGIETKPSTYTPVSEIPDRPGLFSGEHGEFVIFRR